MAKLFRVVLPVSDIELAADFYFQVFGVKGKRVAPGKHFFDYEGVSLSCYDPLANGDKLGQGWMHHENQFTYFSVKNLDALYFRLMKVPDAEIDSNIKENEIGERLFYALDPFGNPLCFVDEKTVFEG
jgi:catechol 2,3-dioxygenase-like lactoylglutathione lyase family enzyme